MKVIFVDDETMAHVKFKNYAKRSDIYNQSDLFYDSVEALQYARGHDIDLAILDIEMPEINGIELGRQLKQMDQNIRLVYITGYGDYALDAFKVDAIGYLVKPYSYDEFEKELEKAKRVQEIPKNKVYIQTMPRFEVFIDGIFRSITKTRMNWLQRRIRTSWDGFMWSFSREIITLKRQKRHTITFYRPTPFTLP